MPKKQTASMTSEKDEALAESSSAEAPDLRQESSAAAPDLRQEMASKLVSRFAIWSGVAGLIPVPFIDVAAVGGLQLQMLRRITQIYDIKFSENSGKAVLASLVGSMIPATSGIGAASMLKAVPFLGMLASGIVMPTLSAGATYAIGKTFIQHFEGGGTLLDFSPPDYREFVKAQKEMWDSQAKPGQSNPSETAPEAATTSS